MSEQDICSICGHYKFLHDIYSMVCAACDDPTVDLKDRCPEYKD